MIAMWQVQQAQSAELADHGVRYAWVITHEYEQTWDAARQDYVGRWLPVDVAGPSTATDVEIERARQGKAFKIGDGDDLPVCKGRMWTSDAAHPADSEAAFAPLDDYGRGNYGATSIFYRNDRNEWSEL